MSAGRKRWGGEGGEEPPPCHRALPHLLVMESQRKEEQEERRGEGCASNGGALQAHSQGDPHLFHHGTHGG